MHDAWIGFAGDVTGGIIGAVVTIIAVIITFNHNTKEMLKQKRMEVIPFIDIQNENINDLKDIKDIRDKTATLIYMEEKEGVIRFLNTSEYENEKLNRIINQSLKGDGIGAARHGLEKTLEKNDGKTYLTVPITKILKLKNIGMNTAVNVILCINEQEVTPKLHISKDDEVLIGILIPFALERSLQYQLSLSFEDLYKNKYRQTAEYIIPIDYKEIIHVNTSEPKLVWQKRKTLATKWRQNH